MHGAREVAWHNTPHAETWLNHARHAEVRLRRGEVGQELTRNADDALVAALRSLRQVMYVPEAIDLIVEVLGADAHVRKPLVQFFGELVDDAPVLVDLGRDEEGLLSCACENATRANKKGLNE